MACWARHIKRIELCPPGELGERSTGRIHLTNGIEAPFTMTEFNPPHNWMWAGPILGLTVSYDHKFEALDAEQTRLTWTVAAEGRGASVLGRMYAGFYRGNMERAIVQLIREMNSSAASV